jgi:outer membrane lipoprotein carrier protein
VSKIIVGLLSFLFASLSFSMTPAAHLQALLAPIKTLQADFKQRTTDSASGAVTKAQGSFKIQRPGKFYWQVDKPGKQIIVINNGRLWLYDVDLQQVTIKKIKTQATALNPASLLSGDLVELLKNNTVTERKRETGDAIRLVPKQEAETTRWIDILFARNKLTGLRFENQLGQVTMIEFSNLQENKPLLRNSFSLKVPKSADAVKN